MLESPKLIFAPPAWNFRKWMRSLEDLSEPTSLEAFRSEPLEHNEIIFHWGFDPFCRYQVQRVSCQKEKEQSKCQKDRQIRIRLGEQKPA